MEDSRFTDTYATDKNKIDIELKRSEIEKLENQLSLAKKELEKLLYQLVCNHEYGESENWGGIAFRAQCKKCDFYNFHI